MSKDKVAKGVLNKHLHARTAFLYQAAAYLTFAAGANHSAATGRDRNTFEKSDGAVSCPAPHLISHLRAISRKGQTRLSPELKRSICKTCDSVLIPGRTADYFTENESKNGKKPWADISVIQCKICQSKKRFPVGAKRQQRKTDRAPISSTIEPMPYVDRPQANSSSEGGQSSTSAIPTSTAQTPSSV